jgi:L-asparagine transporter-like permease
MMFSLSRAGNAPRAFGRLSKSGVPVRALLLSSSGIAVAAVLSVAAPQTAFILMVAISAFGAMFTWLMIFVTHYRFRKALGPAPATAWRTAGFPFTTLLGAALMAAVLITTAFTPAFRMTLAFGVPFLALLALTYAVRGRRPSSDGDA